MREVQVIARCDRCGNDVEVTDDPLPRWTLEGTTYRPELCEMCRDNVFSFLGFLGEGQPAAHRKTADPKNARKKQRTGGKFAKVETPCPACERVFSTPSGVSQHMSQLVKKGDRAHKKYIKDGGEV